ncbi:putative intracellular protease/amidase [Epilithonimonas hungarica]|uniref:DJ-1/PfpI family protein n=1 Tax=Epilithonimonas hungarica TaxID=454006 RepID=UPI00277D4DEB|nr:DJ-1/PfpI family protein [Epilithonimonas hungarica]MDP9954427.1 putative intracellular protease/amidase [Epilithonimonas hungarica]
MEIVIYIYNGLTALDAVGPYEVLSRLPDADVKFVAKEKGVIVTDTHFLKLVAEYDMTEIEKADILIIPGSVAGFIRESQDKNLLPWINRIHETTIWTTSVCSGSIILAAAGLLKNKKATSHWGVIHLLKSYGAIPTSERYVQEGKIITAQGVSAGIDMSLYLAGQIVGVEKAKAYQLFIEYDPSPPFNSGSINKADNGTIDLAQKILGKEAKKDLSIWDIVKNAKTLIKLKKINKN